MGRRQAVGVVCALLVLRVAAAQAPAAIAPKQTCTGYTTCTTCVAGGCAWDTCANQCQSAPSESCTKWTWHNTYSGKCACSPNLLLGTSGTLTDGTDSYTDYATNLNCRFFLAPTTSHDITTATFTRFSLETSSLADYDYVDVLRTDLSYQQFPGSAEHSVRYLGDSPTIPARTCVGNGDNMVVIFFSDFSIVSTGWALSYSSYNYDEGHCCGNRTLTTSTGSFTDGSGASNYLTDNTCLFALEPPLPDDGLIPMITLSFDEFSLHPSDSLTITKLDGSVVASITGTEAFTYCFEEHVLVTFTSDGSGVSTGFAASYTTSSSAEGCGLCSSRENIYTNASGVISDSNFLPRGCTFLVNAGAGYDTVGFEVTELALLETDSLTLFSYNPADGSARDNGLVLVGSTGQGNTDSTTTPYLLVVLDAAQPGQSSFSVEYTAASLANRENVLSALGELYSTTTGSAWTKRDNWATDESPCAWFGVECHVNLITKIILPTNNLSGSLTAAFVAQLAAVGDGLEELDLADNGLYGTIPAGWDLPSLVKLDLSENDLSGSIPLSLVVLPSLEELDLSDNDLEGSLPDTFAESLRAISIQSNYLTGEIPANFPPPSLVTLECAENFLIGTMEASNTKVPNCSPARVATCGDGVWWAGGTCSVGLEGCCDATPEQCCEGWREGCDDGNTDDGDGCSSSCSVEQGWYCEGTVLSTCYPVECQVILDAAEFAQSLLPAVTTAGVSDDFNVPCVGPPSPAFVFNDLALAVSSPLCSVVTLFPADSNTLVLDAPLEITSDVRLAPHDSEAMLELVPSGTLAVVHSGAVLTLEHVAVANSDNQGGSGVLVVQGGGVAVLRNCSFVGNRAAEGSVVLVQEGGGLVMEHTVVANNTAGLKGAVVAEGGTSVDVAWSRFEHNTPTHLFVPSTPTTLADTTFVCDGTPHVHVAPGGTVDAQRTTATSCTLFALPSVADASATLPNSNVPALALRDAFALVVDGSVDVALVAGSDFVLDAALALHDVTGVTVRGEGGTAGVVSSPGGFLSVAQASVTLTDLHITSAAAAASQSYVVSATGSVLAMERVLVDGLGMRAVAVTGGSLALTDCTVADVATTGLGAANPGGAVRALGGNPQVRLTRCAFERIASAGMGSVVVGDGPLSLAMVDCEVRNVTAGGKGGAVSCSGCTVDISTSAFHNVTSGDEGGAVYVSGAHLTVASSTFAQGAAVRGGVAFASGASVVLQHCVAEDNRATQSGGVVEITSSTQLQATNCTFRRNAVPTRGGAVRAGTGHTVTIAACSFADNTANRGGAVSLGGQTGDCNVTGSTFTANECATGEGGAVHADVDAGQLRLVANAFVGNVAVLGGAAYLGSGAAAEDHHSVFVANTALQGGAVFLSQTGQYLATNVSLERNHAQDSGGAAACLLSSAMVLEQSRVEGNDALGSGGGLYIGTSGHVTVSHTSVRANSARRDGGGMLVFGSDPAILSSTFELNTADGSGGGFSSLLSSPVFTNSTLANNTAHSGGGASSVRGGLRLVDCALAFNSAKAGGALFVSATELTALRSRFASNTASHSGGAMQAYDNTIPVSVDQCDFDDNRAGIQGGAVALISASALVTGCGFARNGAGFTGGAVFADSVDNATLVAAVGRWNYAERGGFLMAQSSRVAVVGSDLHTNRATADGGALYLGTYRPCEVRHTRLALNTAGGEGGGVALSVPAVSTLFTTSDMSDEDSLTLQGVTCDGNTAVRGACAALRGQGQAAARALVQDCTLSQNTATEEGGAVFGYEMGEFALRGSYVQDNAGTSGGGLFLSECTGVELHGSRVANNVAGGERGSGGGVMVKSGEDVGIHTTASVTNCVFESNQANNGGGGGIFWLDVTINVTSTYFSNNHALFGNSIASSGAALTLVSGPHTVTTTSGATLPSIAVALVDNYGNVVASESTALVRVTLTGESEVGGQDGHTGASGGVGGADIQQLSAGVATFDGLEMFGEPTRSYELAFQLTDGSVVSPSLLEVHVAFKEDKTSDGVYNIFGVVSKTLEAVLFVFVWTHRKHSVIHNSSPWFCLITICGAAVMSTALFTLDPSKTKCMARMWFLTIGSSLMFGSLALKVYRIYCIFENPRLKSVRLPNSTLMRGLVALLLVDVALLVPISLVDSPTKNFFVVSGTGHYSCDYHGRGALAAVFAVKCVLLLVGCYLAFKGRNVKAAFNESKSVVACIYNFSFFALFTAISAGTLSPSSANWKAGELSFALGVLFGSSASLLILFLPKMQAVCTPWLMKRLTKSSKMFAKEPLESFGSESDSRFRGASIESKGSWSPNDNTPEQTPPPRLDTKRAVDGLELPQVSQVTVGDRPVEDS